MSKVHQPPSSVQLFAHLQVLVLIVQGPQYAQIQQFLEYWRSVR